MSRQPVSVEGRAEVAELKQELLGRLGLRTDAGDQEVEAAHNDLVEFLELAPHELKSWAEAQAADVDEAFALLCGPEKDLVSHGLERRNGQLTAPPPACLTVKREVRIDIRPGRGWWVTGQYHRQDLRQIFIEV
jgi:hypothetical protein